MTLGWLGAATWVLVAVASGAGLLPLSLIDVLALLAPLVVVPLGLGLADQWDSRRGSILIRRTISVLLPIAACLMVASFLFPAGFAAACFAGAWLVVTLLAALGGMQRVTAALAATASRGAQLSECGGRGPGRWEGQQRSLLGRTDRAPRFEDACVAAALGYLPVGGAWLLLSRAGIRPMGFVEPIPILTGVHFHYAAFAALILAGETGRLLRRARPYLARTAFPLPAMGAMAGPGLLAAGWALSNPPLKMAAATILAVSHASLALLTLSVLSQVRRVPRLLLAVSAASLVLAMILAALYAFGEYREITTISLPLMARTHGLLNGPGFTVLGLLGWRLQSQGVANMQERWRNRP